MRRKLINIGVIDSEDNKMENKLNYLITNFDQKEEYETNDEFKFRLSFHKFITETIKLKGDVAIMLTYMMINRIKYDVKYSEKHENILDRIESEYILKR